MRNAIELIGLVFGVEFADQIFRKLTALEAVVTHSDYKGRLSLEMAEEKVKEVAQAATLDTPLSATWSAHKQMLFVEAYLPSEWKECSQCNSCVINNAFAHRGRPRGHWRSALDAAAY